MNRITILFGLPLFQLCAI